MKTRNFLSTWVYKDDNLCFFVDCGPTSTIEPLGKGLNKIGISENNREGLVYQIFFFS